MGFLANKKILIVGMLSNRSIAYGIAKAMHREGAELAFTYFGERFEQRVKDLAQDFSSNIVLPCDVGDDSQIEQAVRALGQQWDRLDGLIHSVAFAPSDQLEGNYTDVVSREGFRIAHDVSSYSLAALAKATRSLLQKASDGDGAAILTLTYLGAERAVPNYNVMGVAKASLEANVRYLAGSLGQDNIRVNAISAGPIRTLAASGIKDFRKILNAYENVVPLKRNITIEDVGNTAAFLCSYLANSITGEVVHVDNGYHAIDPLLG
ncbi:MAG: enoyl-ACP reductase [Gammaproteobacteria bacterium]|nr:enoyl-ACP reductase [Gammaproteobacteria bacterium]